jgi:23S rRNA U2552 (ribose-2'-O)-methylase RlmE/FtsJ
MNQPFLIKLPKVENKNIEINNNSDDLILSSVMSYPLFALGFHCFVNRTRSGMAITKNLESKTNFYYVVNPFETEITNYDDDIQKQSKIYFKNKDQLSYDFYKFWEIIFIFELVKKETNDCLVISDTSINEVLELYKDKIGLKNKLNIVNSEKENKKKFDLIILNQNIKTDDINFVEQEYYKDLLQNILTILKNQTDDGNSILKFYDSFTLTTIKAIYIISSFFDEVSVYKPFVSRQADTERYLILKGFTSNKNVDKFMKSLESLVKSIDNKKFISDIYPELVISKDFLDTFRFLNVKLVNYQQIMINEIIKYIKENNYFGDKYHVFRDKQIESSKWWVTNFFPPSENIYKKNKEELGKLYKTNQEKLNVESQKFNEVLIN